jgi:hypothetical protein
LSVNFDNGDRLITHLLPEEVPLHLKVLCAAGDALVYGREKGPIIVFEDLKFDGCAT